MTAIAATQDRPRLSRRAKISLAVLAALAVGWLAYFSHYGECDFRSQFCVLNIAGTRSEIGVEWSTWSLYVSTSGNDPATHVLVQL
jgi:hypothetical protein